MTFQEEPYRLAQAEMLPLLVDHWHEVADHKAEIPWAPDWSSYAKLEELGILSVFTAREGAELAGYYVNSVMPHPHYRGSLFAFIDVYYLAPNFRKGMTAMRFLMAMEERMRDRGVRVMIGRARLKMGTGPLFERLGWSPVETCYTKLLEAHG